MVLDARTKKYMKLFMLIGLILVLTGCTRNLDSNGKLLAERAITSSTKWTPAAGMFDFLLVIPIAKGIIFLSNLTGNVAWGVVGMTFLINLIILPVMIKSTVSAQKMQLLQPELEKIQNKYRGRNDQTSQLRMSQEMQELYKKHDVSMFGSLITFVTLPIMFAMWQAVQRVEIVYSANFLGLNLGVTPMNMVFKGNIPNIILIALMGFSQFFAIEISNIMLKRNKNYKKGSQQNSMKTMNITMTVMIIYFGLIMPAAMSFYWITTNIITILRTIYIQIFHIEKEEAQRKTNFVR